MPQSPLIRALDPEGPVVIGGGGGSGTRVVAGILRRLGFNLGQDRNSADDNLLVTLLLKRPRWHSHAGSGAVERALATLDRGLLHGCGMADLPVLAGAAWDMILYNRDYGLPRRVLWTLRRLRAALRRPEHNGKARGWGWKEPNSHVYLERLVRRYSRLRYIHVIRHGLDMAYSSNQAQLHNWGSLFGVEADGASSQPQRALRYWIHSNQAVLEKGEHLLGDRFLVIRYDELCDRPRDEVGRLCEFLGVAVDEEELQALAAMPRSPSSRGRYRGRNLSDFDAASIAAVESMGFAVDRPREEVQV